MKMKLLLIFSALSLLLPASAEQPNIIFLLTDDQDVTANSLDYMPKLNTILRQGGMEFVNYFVTTALCCPSRSTIIKGQYCHNHGIWDNGDLNNKTFFSGGMKKAIDSNLEKETVATLMKAAGYETFLIGKYLNGYGDSYADHVPPGWDHWHGMTSTAYYGPHFSIDGKLFKADKDTYQTDYISENARKMISGRDKSKPFFIYISPFAPHAPSLPAKRHENLFNNMSAPRTDSFNPSDDLQKQKPSWLKTLPKLTDDQIASIDNFYRNRLRALQAVDEMLENITLLLEKEGIDKNTYLFYMGDNGQHLGDYRLPGGKRQAYDTDIRVPFLVKGPGIAGGVKVTQVVMSIDLLPTWVDLGKGNLPSSYQADGLSIVPILTGQDPAQPDENGFRAAALAEMYGGSSNMGSAYKKMAGFEGNRFWNNTYQAVRVINGSDWAKGANWLYAEWCTGEREFYNVTADKRQIKNIIDDVDADLLKKLSSLTEMLGQCSGKSCNDVSFHEIARASALREDVTYVKCHNPPDMSSNPLTADMSDDLWNPTGASPTAELCHALIAKGFPYSDEETVAENVLDMWNYCLAKHL